MTKEFPRRKLVTMSGVAVLTLSVGCMSNDDSKTKIDEIYAVNRSGGSHTLNILLTENGEPVYWKSETLKSDGGTVDQSEKEFRNYPSTPGEYILYAWVDDQDHSKWKEYDLGEYESSCAKLLILVEEQNEQVSADINASSNC